MSKKEIEDRLVDMISDAVIDVIQVLKQYNVHPTIDNTTDFIMDALINNIQQKQN